MISYSCAEYSFPLLSPAQRFALLKLLGFEYVDIGLFERSAGLQPSQLHAEPGAFIKQLQSDLGSTGLKVADIFLQIGSDPAVSAANDPNLPVRSRNHEMFLLALDVCAALDCKHLTGLPGVWHDRVAEADDLALAVDEAGWRQHAASGAGITYGIEPHIGSICADIAQTRSLLESVPGLTLTLDYGHFVWADIPSDDVHSLLPFASHMHARGGAPARLQTPVGENEIDFESIMRRLRESEYKGFVAIEYVYTDWGQCNRTDNVSETVLLRRLLEGYDSPRN